MLQAYHKKRGIRKAQNGVLLNTDEKKRITYTPFIAKWDKQEDNTKDLFSKLFTSQTPIIIEPTIEEVVPDDSAYTKTYNIPSTEQPTVVQEEIVTTPTRGKTIFKTEGIDVGKMQELIDKFNDYGINLRITSGLRPGAIAASGRPSRHGIGEAIDVTPIEGETFESLKEQLKKATELVEWMKANGYGILDETTPEAMKKNKSTGVHWHIGKDSTIQDWWKTFFLRQGGILRKQPGGSLFTPYLQSTPYVQPTWDSNDPISFWDKNKFYVPKYNLNQTEESEEKKQDETPKGPLSLEYMAYLKEQEENQKKEEEKRKAEEKWHNKLYEFTKSYETFSPNVYPDVDGNLLIGYGSKNPALIKKGTITEEEAFQEMKDYYADREKEFKSKIKQWDELDDDIKLVLMEISYNSGPNFLDKSPNLSRLLRNGVTDRKKLATELLYSGDWGSWLQARARARQAIAAGEYDWDGPVDSHGRRIVEEPTHGMEDWYDSPYYNYTYTYDGYIPELEEDYVQQ